VGGIGTVTVKSVGWGLAADGEFMTWGAVLFNPGVDRSLVKVNATGFDAAGDAIDNSDATLFRMPNGEALVGGIFMGKGIKKVKVDVGAGTDYNENNPPISGGLRTKLTITGHSFPAVISAKVTSTLGLDTKDGMGFYIVYRDKTGKVVGGSQGFAPGSFKAGKTRSVALQNSMSNPPVDRYATADIFFDVSDSYLKAS
jgi:hypothetical protein